MKKAKKKAAPKKAKAKKAGPDLARRLEDLEKRVLVLETGCAPAEPAPEPPADETPAAA